MTRRERMERRAERRLEWAASRKRDAEARFAAVHRLADSIPLGQPILVGHHSERHARRDAERIQNGMRAGLESETMAHHHESKADGIQRQLDNSIYSDDRDAVEQLEARIREREAEVARIKELNVKIRKEYKAGLQAGWLDRIGATEAEARAIANNAAYGWQKTPMFPAYHLSNLNGRIRADRERLKAIRYRAEKTAEAEAAGGMSIRVSGEYAIVTFAEKPERSVIDALKAAGFWWGGGSWSGKRDALPKELDSASG